MSAFLAASPSPRAAHAACFCLSFILLASWSTDAAAPSSESSHASLRDIHATRILTGILDSPYHHHYTVRISDSDLHDRHALEERIQLAVFQQFGRGKTGRIYNISVAAIPSVTVQAVRLRSGSFRRYGVTINEFTIPTGCTIDPIPERIMVIYIRLANTTLFGDLPQGYVLASPILFVLSYDATNLNGTHSSEPLNVSTTSIPISIQFAERSGLVCASFDAHSTNVSYTDSVQGTCRATQFGTFALVSNASAQAPIPLGAPITVPSRLPSSHSNAWKIVVGSVVGGFAMLVLVSLFAFGFVNYWKKAKFASMEYQTAHGETLQTTAIGNSRVPAAGSTRTQSMIEREYTA